MAQAQLTEYISTSALIKVALLGTPFLLLFSDLTRRAISKVLRPRSGASFFSTLAQMTIVYVTITLFLSIFGALVPLAPNSAFQEGLEALWPVFKAAEPPSPEDTRERLQQTASNLQVLRDETQDWLRLSTITICFLVIMARYFYAQNINHVMHSLTFFCLLVLAGNAVIAVLFPYAHAAYFEIIFEPKELLSDFITLLLLPIIIISIVAEITFWFLTSAGPFSCNSQSKV